MMTDDDRGSVYSFPLNEINFSQIPPSIAFHRLTEYCAEDSSLIDENFSIFLIKEPENSCKESECKDSYVSNLNEPVLLVTHLSDANEDEYFDPGGDIDEIDDDVSTDIKDSYHDSEGDIIYLESSLINDTIPNLPPEVFLDHDPKSLNDNPNIDDLKIKENVRITPDYEDSRTRGFVHCSLELKSLACLFMGIRYPRSY
ncbi:hypothetical protein Tco_1191730 [Tanacetum coccineum]